VKRARIGELERGKGASAPLFLWVRLGKVVDRPFAASFSRDLREPPEPVDAGHLAAQELVLRFARSAERVGAFELPTRSSGSPGVVDVAIRDDGQRVLILVEIWNRLTDLGAASRSTTRKVIEVEGAILPAGFRLASCWLLVDNAANRAIVRRFREIVRARFLGSAGSGLSWTDTSRRATPESPGSIRDRARSLSSACAPDLNAMMPIQRDAVPTSIRRIGGYSRRGSWRRRARCAGCRAWPNHPGRPLTAWPAPRAASSPGFAGGSSIWLDRGGPDGTHGVPAWNAGVSCGGRRRCPSPAERRRRRGRRDAPGGSGREPLPRR